MVTQIFTSRITESTIFVFWLIKSIVLTSSTRILDEYTPEPIGAPAEAPVPYALLTTTFFMHDILGGTYPSARAITGIVDNPAVNAEFPFAKPNNGVLVNNGNSGFINNNNIPFLTGLSGMTSNVFQNNGININSGLGLGLMGRLPVGSTIEKLMFGTMMVIDDELTDGPELGSTMVGRAQGFYVASSVDGNGQVMALTTMFENGNYVDTLCLFGVHLMGVSESQLAIMGGTGKFVNAKGFAIIKTLLPTTNQQVPDGVETIMEFNVFVIY